MGRFFYVNNQKLCKHFLEDFSLLTVKKCLQLDGEIHSHGCICSIHSDDYLKTHPPENMGGWIFSLKKSLEII